MKNLLKEVDVINDREYILSELKKSESEKSYSFEESYEYGMNYINNYKIMKTVDKEKIVKIPSIMDSEYSFKEICINLENRKISFEKSGKKGSTIEETLYNYL